jgi:hypothetical protein
MSRMSQLNVLSLAQLKQAVSLKEKISKLEAQLASLLGSPTAQGKPDRRRRAMSAAGRARISAAQKARWAKLKAAKKK